MNITFEDLQTSKNPLNGSRIEGFADMKRLLHSWRSREPFLFELRADGGFMMTVGFAGSCGTAQYSPASGLPPYLMALSGDVLDETGFVEFLAGDTPTPISRRYCLPMEELEKVLANFFEDGTASQAVEWEEI